MLMSEYLARRELALDILAQCLSGEPTLVIPKHGASGRTRPGSALLMAGEIVQPVVPWLPKITREDRHAIVDAARIGNIFYDTDDCCVYMLASVRTSNDGSVERVWTRFGCKRPKPRDRAPLPLP